MINTTPVILLIGGRGSRMDNLNLANTPPKALTTINSQPLIIHSMKNFLDYGYNNFIFALGYKGDIIKKYFEKKIIIKGRKINFIKNLNDFNKFNNHKSNHKDNHINILLLNTGKNSNKTQRIYKIISCIETTDFIVSYGDGVGDVNLNKMKNLHYKNKFLCTCASYIPQSQYGHFIYSEGNIINFVEKPKLVDKINIGYFFFRQEAAKFIKKYINIDLETGVIKNFALKGKIQTYHHKGFWKSVDTLKDANDLSRILKHDKK